MENETALLRVGILCPGGRLQRWQLRVLEELRAVAGVSFVLRVIDDRPVEAPKPMLQRAWGTALYRRYRKRMRSEAMAEVDTPDFLHDVTELRCTVQRHKGTERFSERDLEKIAAKRPDVLLRFGFNVLSGGILDLPRHGVWSFHHGDEEKYRGGPPVFWEIMENDPVTGAVLQRLTDRLDGGVVLRKGWFKTIDHALRETVDTVLMASAHWPAQVARELLAGDERSLHAEPSTTKAQVRRYPDNFTFLRFLARTAGNKARFHRQQLVQHEEWNIGVLYQPIQALLADRPSLNVRWLPSPSKGFFRADPFGYRDAEGQLTVLYEKYEYASGRGVIARLRPKRDNTLKRSRTLLDNGAHLSYPFLFEHEGVRYAVPEGSASGKVTMYRLDPANDAFEPLADLLHEPLCDPTLFEYEGGWWLAGTKAPLTNVALHLYHAPSPFGPFAPHAQNPVKLDIRSARPGGTPFVHEGALYRPGQDSSITYGHRIALNRIDELTPLTFRETTVKHIGPIKGSYSAGLHTISAVGDVTLVDGKRWTHDRAQERRVMKKKFGRLRDGDREMAEDDLEDRP